MTHEAPEEAMRFGVTLYQFVQRVLTSDTRIGPIYRIKVNLYNTYIHLWVWI